MGAQDALRPEYVLFAGVNGVGKSTFYHTFAWARGDAARKMPRVNSDEMLVAAHGDWASPQDQAKAAKEAVRTIRELMGKGQSFNQETTLSGRSSMKRIDDAARLGYRVRMFYIGIDSPLRAQKRIVHREELGGHGIEEEVVVRRYFESLANLSRATRMCDEVIVLDNTLDFVEIARWNAGVLSWVGRLGQRGQWLMDAIRDDGVWGDI